MANSAAGAQRIHDSWHAFAKVVDYEGIASLYVEDAIFESPLVPLVMGTRSGILEGRAAIERFFQTISERPANPAIKWYRSGRLLAAGDDIAWEYPRQTPDGEQLDILEMMTLRDDLIAHHRIYLGWKTCLALAQRWAEQVSR